MLKKAMRGDKAAEKEILQQLSARFCTVTTHILKTHPILAKHEQKKHTTQIIEKTIAIIKEKYSPVDGKFNLMSCSIVLRNCIDEFIANELTELARAGNKQAEEALFSLLRDKLMVQINRKRKD